MKRFLTFLAGTVILLLITDLVVRHSGSGNNGRSEGIRQPNDWFYRQRSYPYAQMRSDLFYQALEQAREMAAVGLKSGQPPWELVGPINVGGRITDVEMHHSDKNTVYIAAASGGIFKSSNLGDSWVPVFDDAMALAVGDMDIAGTDANILYAGTGEPNAGGGSHTYEGNGIYKSLDGGQTWINTGLRDAGSIGRVKIDPVHPDTVYVAAMGHLFADNSERGVFRTRNGGQSWDKVLYLSDSTGASDLCINTRDSRVIYAAMWERTRRPPYQSYGGKSSGIWKSVNGGDTWSELTTGLPKGNVGRIGMDISDSNPEVLYATYTDSTGYLLGIYKTINGGDSWAQTASIGENTSYWWWFSEVDIDPLNHNVAYVSGLFAYKTGNGGDSWSQAFGSSVHVDQHGVFIHPADNSLVLLGNDGGLYISRSGSSTSFHVNNLPITQFYTCEVDYQNPNRFYGGTQDNGTIRTLTGRTDDWHDIYGGDGFVVKVDPTDNKYVYVEYQYGGLRRSINGGTSFMGATTGIGTDRTNWKTPLELDPQNPSILYFGTNRLYKSINRAVSWVPISDDLTRGPGENVTYGTLTTISVSPLDGRIIYVGTDDGNVWNTLDGGAKWNKVSKNNLPDRWITCVNTDPFDKKVAYVTISGYRWDSYLPHVYKTTDNGLTWNSISGNLPDFPVNSIVIDPELENTCYIGTDGGVFFTRNGGESWEIYGQGMPLAPVFDLNLHNPTRKLVAATFGRSMYRADLPASTSARVVAVNPTILQAYPNPFSSSIHINFHLERETEGKLAVIDLTGKEVSIIHQGKFREGSNQFAWNGQDSRSAGLPPGLYMVLLESDHVKSYFRIIKRD